MKIIRKISKKVRNYLAAWKTVISKNPNIKENFIILLVILIVILLIAGWFYVWGYWYPNYICDNGDTLGIWKIYASKKISSPEELCEKGINLGCRLGGSIGIFALAAYFLILIICCIFLLGLLLVVIYTIAKVISFKILRKEISQDEKGLCQITIILLLIVVGLFSVIFLPLMYYDSIACYLQIDPAFKSSFNGITLEEMCSGKYDWYDLNGVSVFIFTILSIIGIVLLFFSPILIRGCWGLIKENIIIHCREVQEIYNEAEEKV